MPLLSSLSGRALLGGTVALALLLAAAPRAAQAAGGDITRGAVLGIAAGVALDELHHQYTRRPPNYVYVVRPRRRVARGVSGYVPAPRPSPLARAFDSQDKRIRVSIQYTLMQRGLYHASLDGIWGPSTRDALYTYAHRHNELAMLTTEPEANRLFSQLLK